MQSAISVKAGVAFLAGIVLALGGTFTYFKVTDAHSQPAQTKVQEIAPVQDLTSVAKPADPPLLVPPVQTPEVRVVEPEPVKHKPTPHKVIEAKLAQPKPKLTSRPVSLAVANPPSQYQEPISSAPAPIPAGSPSTQSAIPALPPAPPPISEPAPASPPQPHTVTIPAGTNVAVRLNEKISTDHNYSGDTFRATLDAPIVIDGFVIADRGAKVLGKIVKAQKPGKFEGSAELSLTLTEIATTDGQRMQVQTNESLRKGPSNTNQEVAKMGGGTALGAIIGAIAGGGRGAAIGAGAGAAAGTGAVLLGHGKAATIDNETRLTFATASPTTVTEKLN